MSENKELGEGTLLLEWIGLLQNSLSDFAGRLIETFQLVDKALKVIVMKIEEQPHDFEGRAGP